MTEDFRITDGVLTFPDTVHYLKSQMFAGRKDIRKVIIHPQIGVLEEEVFADCSNLEEVELYEGLVNIGIADFTSCTSLKSISVPVSVSEIEEGAFLDCEGLESVTLREGLERIADLAFQNCAIEEIRIPSSVKEIGEEAFFDCQRLRSADVLGKDTLIRQDAFGSNYNLIKGYIAPGYPEEQSGPAELLYSLLWAGCPERHGASICERAETFIRGNEKLVMERIFESNNVPAMSGIAARKLLAPENIDAYVKQSLELKRPEITALLLSAKGNVRNTEGEFEL